MSDVSSIIDAAKSNASTLLTGAVQAIGAANDALSNINPSVVTPGGFKPPTYNQPKDIGTFPAIPTATFTMTPAPSLVPITAVPSVNSGGMPSLEAVPLAYTLPNKPSEVAPFTQQAPTINTNLTFPTAPTLIVPTAPTQNTYTMPTAPQLTMPSFNAAMPTDTSTAPTNLDQMFETQQANVSVSFVQAVSGYVDAMMNTKFPNYQAQSTAMNTQLQKYFAGGTALAPAIEDAIYNRARAKNDLEVARTQDAVMKDFAARGFTMPPGALSSMYALARRDAQNNNAKMTNEIAIAQAEMEQKNLQFAVTTSATLHQVAVNATIAYMQNLIQLNGQSIQYAQAVVSALVETYNAQVRLFTSKLEAYRAQAAVYETQLKAVMTGIDIYKAQIEAVQALVQVDRMAVDVFRARIETLTAQENLYRSQIEAVQSQANLEKLKIELFQSQVNAFAAQVQAKNAEYQGYTAQIEGEVSKTKIYVAQVEAYSAKVQGYKAQIEAQLGAVQAAAATNQAVGQTNEANLKAYQASMQAQGEVARTQIAVGQTAIQAYEATSHAVVASASASAEYYKATTAAALGQAQLDVNALLENAKVSVAAAEAVARVTSGNASIYGSLASSAMAGVNALASEQLTL